MKPNMERGHKILCAEDGTVAGGVWPTFITTIHHRMSERIPNAHRVRARTGSSANHTYERSLA